MGLGMQMPLPVRFCPQNYGLTTYERYVNWRDVNRPRTVDQYHGKEMINQLTWLIRKGDLILPNEPLVAKISLKCKMTMSQYNAGHMFRETFVASASHDPPDTVEELSDAFGKWSIVASEDNIFTANPMVLMIVR